MDGFNTVITLEVALSDSLLLTGMDSTIRDLAGLRGTYRIVDKTVTAVELLLEKAAGRALEVQAELHPSVDGLLSRMENVVTSDAIILDKCKSWYNLNRPLIGSAVPDAWILRLDVLQQEGMSCQS